MDTMPLRAGKGVAVAVTSHDADTRAAVISLDKHSRRITVSIKALEIAEEKQAVAQYGSSDSGASLGDIFKAAIKKKEGADEKKEDGEDSEG